MSAFVSRGLRLPRHRATTAQACCLFPFVAQAPLPGRRVPLGVDRLGTDGIFRFDPFELYGEGVVTNPNIVVVGEPGSGKSAAVKTFCHRQLTLPGGRRFLAVIDPKGEYGPLAAALGLTVVRLHPGGSDLLNPLDPGLAPGRPEEVATRRMALVDALLSSVLRRSLTPIEEAATAWALDEVGARRVGGAPTLVDVAAVLARPTPAMVERAGRPANSLARDLDPLRFALGRLLERDLRGMLDGPSTVRLDPDGPGVVVDLSALHHDPFALALVMVAAAAWLQAVLATAPEPGAPRRILVLDEAWALLASERTTRFLQASFKLCRAWGVANVAVTHRVSDLRAQADDGTATAKLAEGLLADAQTRVVFRQSPDQVPLAKTLLGLSDRQASLVPQLGRGVALWNVAGRAHLVEHVISAAEWPTCDTDAGLTG